MEDCILVSEEVVLNVNKASVAVDFLSIMMSLLNVDSPSNVIPSLPAVLLNIMAGLLPISLYLKIIWLFVSSWYIINSLL